MKDINDCLGLPLISLDTSEEIGQLTHFLTNPVENRIVGFAVSNPKWFTESNALVFGDVAAFGVDAIIVKAKDAVKPISQVGDVQPFLFEGQKRMVRQAVSADGQSLGTLTDWSFEERSGDVTRYRLEGVNGHGEAWVPREAFVRSGKAVVILNSNPFGSDSGGGPGGGRAPEQAGYESQPGADGGRGVGAYQAGAAYSGPTATATAPLIEEKPSAPEPVSEAVEVGVTTRVETPSPVAFAPVETPAAPEVAPIEAAVEPPATPEPAVEELAVSLNPAPEATVADEAPVAEPEPAPVLEQPLPETPVLEATQPLKLAVEPEEEQIHAQATEPEEAIPHHAFGQAAVIEDREMEVEEALLPEPEPTNGTGHAPTVEQPVAEQLKDAINRNKDGIIPFVVGKYADRDIHDSHGNRIVAQGEKISMEAANRASQSFKLYDLWIAAQTTPVGEE